MISHSRAAARRSSSKGFSLTEVLVVISITAILATLTASSLAGLSKADRFDLAVNNLSETLGLARQTAVTHNTYVWVAFSIPTTPSDPPLATLMVASCDGTNPFSTAWSSTVTLPGDPRFLIVAKQAKYAQCQFLDSDSTALSTSQIPTLPSPQGTGINGLGTGLSFKFNTPAGQVTYNRVIEYAPTGLAYNGPNPVAFVEFGVVAALNPSATAPNVACFRVPFITGRTALYRP